MSTEKLAGAARVYAQALARALPWVEALPLPDRDRFVAEVAGALCGQAPRGRFAMLDDLVEDWRNTAAVWSDASLAEALSREVAAPLGRPVE